MSRMAFAAPTNEHKEREGKEGDMSSMMLAPYDEHVATACHALQQHTSHAQLASQVTIRRSRVPWPNGRDAGLQNLA